MSRLTDYVDFVREIYTPVIVAHVARVVTGIRHDQIFEYYGPLRVPDYSQFTLWRCDPVFEPRYVRQRIAYTHRDENVIVERSV